MNPTRLRLTRALSTAALALWLGSSALVPARAASIEGQHYDDAVTLARSPLQLNGVGLRGVAFIRAFVVGLYVEHPSTEPARLIEADGPKRVAIRMLMDAPIDLFVNAITNGVKKNTTPDEQAAMADRLARFQANVNAVGEVHVGDRIDLDYLPKKGLVFSFNGRERGATIAGDDLYRAILKMFVGERAVDKKLRQGLLAGGVNRVAAPASEAPASAPVAASTSASAPASVSAPTSPASPAASE
jgi:hypothetical protein